MNTAKYLGSVFFALIVMALPIQAQAVGAEWKALIEEATSLVQRGNYDRAEVLALESLKLAQTQDGMNSIAAGHSLGLLSIAYISQNKADQAEQAAKQSLSIFEKVSGKNDLAKFNALMALARVDISRIKLLEAEKWAKSALSLAEVNRSPDVAAALAMLGAIYQGQDKYDQAEAMLKRSLSLHQQSGPETAEAIEVSWALGAIYAQNGKCTDAQPLLTRALARIEKIPLGQRSTALRLIRDSLASCAEDDARWSEAEKLRTDLLTSARSASEPRPLVNALLSLSSLYEIQDRYAEAMALSDEALGIAAKTGDRLAEAASKLQLASVNFSLGNYSTAEKLASASRTLYEQLVGANNSMALSASGNLAAAIREQKRSVEAMKIYQGLLPAYEKLYGATDWGVASTHSAIGRTHLLAQRFSDADVAFTRARRMLESQFGTEHFRLVPVFDGLADVFLRQGKDADAERLYKQSLNIAERVYGSKNSRLIRSLIGLGAVAAQRGNFSEAEQLLKRALSICESSVGPDHPAAASALKQLAIIYEKTNRKADAAAALQRVRHIEEKKR